LCGDPVKFNQLIVNLLINSIEAYSSSGRIRKPVILICAAQPGGIRVEVTDKGSVIPVELRENIFEPFFTTKPNTMQNMGIGLSMVKRYVEQDFGGSITVRSNKRQGTCFTLHLYNQKDSHASRHSPQEPTLYSLSTSKRR
jgi:signal transduction histidine kinase